MGRFGRLPPMMAVVVLAMVLWIAACNSIGDDAGIAGQGDGESPQEPDRVLNCDADFDEMVTLLRTGLPDYDYEPAPNMADLVARSDAVVVGDVMTVVRFEGHGDGTDVPGLGWTLISSTGGQVRYSFPGPVVEVPQFALGSFWAGPGPDPLAAEVGFEGLSFVAFLDRFESAPTGYAADVQGLVVGCSAREVEAVSVVEPLPADGRGLSVDQLSDVIDQISSSLVERRSSGLDGPVMRHQPPWVKEGEGAEIIGVLELEGDCLYLRPRSEPERFPVVWPALTRWDEAGGVVVLPNGERIGMTDEASGGGGYHPVDRVESFAGPEAATMAAACVDNTYGEVAVVNNFEDGIGRAGS